MKSLSIDLNLLITEALYWFQLARKKTFKFDAITGNVLYVFLHFPVLEVFINTVTKVSYSETRTNLIK